MWKKIKSIIIQSLSDKTHDFTEGSIKLAIVLLAIPMILELSLESVFAIVDIYFVSKLGQSAIATVGFTEALITLIYSVAIGLSTAATAIIARRIGEKSPEEASKNAFNIIIITLLVSSILSILGVIFAGELLAFMGADEYTLTHGKRFTQIMFGTNGVIMLLFVINGIFRGAGDASVAMKSLWIASLINIVLDPLFIYGIGSWDGWGLEGAAIATVIGRSCGVIYQLYRLLDPSRIVHLAARHFKIQFKIMANILNISWPATLQFIIASGSWIVLTKLIAMEGGITSAAGYQIAIRNVVFFILPAWGLSNAAATLMGQNLGANKPERAIKSVELAIKYNIVFMGIISLLFIFCPSYIASLFTSDVEVSRIAGLTMRIFGYGYVFYGIGMVLVQAINGAGDTKTPTVINVICFWLIQIPLGYSAYHLGWGEAGIVAAVPISETLLAVIAYFYFRSGRWKNISV